MSLVAHPAPASSFGRDPCSQDIDAAALFRMGFEPEAVGRALVSTQGDPVKAFSLLSAPPSADAGSSDTTAEEEDDLALAISMSLEHPKQPPQPQQASERPAGPQQAGVEQAGPQRTRRQALSAESVNPLWAPSRYVPPSNSGGTQLLSLVENVKVRDGGYAWQRGKAFLDTGNQHMTIIDSAFAARHSIYRPDSVMAVPGLGQAERWTTIRGVVPGVSSRAPCVTIALSIRDQEYLIQAAVSELGSHDLLLGVDVLDRLFAAGFRIGQGSMA